jgi:hypothetical protein
MMKKFLLMLSVAWAPLQFAADLESDDAQLRHIKTVLWPQAYRTQDAALLDSLLHESFQLIDDSGRRSTKQQELEWIAANAWNPGTFEFRIERLDIYNGQTAVVAGRGIASDYS